MTFEEVITISAVMFIVAFPVALRVRFPLSQVPWHQFLFRSECFGGWAEVLRGVGWLCAWVVLSIGIGVSIGFAAKSSGPMDRYIYDLIDYGGESIGEAGLGTQTILALFFYAFFVSKTKRIVRRRYEFAPADLFSDHDAQNGVDLPNNNTPSSLRKWPRLMAIPRFLVNAVPLLLAEPYTVFHQSTGTILSGCARLLLGRFGKGNICTFFELYQKERPKDAWVSQIVERASQFDRCSTDYTCIILTGLVRLEGYYSVKQKLDNYVKNHDGDKVPNTDRRCIEREFTKLRTTTKCICEGASRKGRIIEYSKDGSGCFVRTNIPLDSRGGVGLKINNHVISGDIMHSDAMLWRRRVVSGSGLCIRESDRKHFLSILPQTE